MRCFPRLTRGRTFFLCRQEESSQRRRRPRVGAGCAGSLRYSVLAGAAELGAAPLRQSSPFARQPLRCSAPLKGARKESRLNQSWKNWPVAVDCKKGTKIKFAPVPIMAAPIPAPDGLPGPLEGAEQRRLGRKNGEHCLRGFSPELRSPRPSRVAQGTGAAGTDPGSPSSLLTFFLAKQEESKARRKRENQRSQEHQTPKPNTPPAPPQG